jgi:hypothetical protein
LDTFGKLSKNQLWWWCVKWEPAGYRGKDPSPDDVQLRATLDKVREQYGFTEGQEELNDDVNGKTMSPAQDDVPF